MEMEALPEAVAAVKAGERRYQTVNGSWPEGPLPKPDGDEAVRGAKRLFRKFTGRAYRGKWMATSGRRNTWPYRGIFYVNPDRKCDHGGGWRAIVHSMSHFVHYFKGGSRPHDAFGRHAFLEREMIAYVVESGWLEGKLKRTAKPKAPVDVKQVRYRALLAKIAKWESKQRRAVTALKKLKRQRTYYERVLKPST